MEKILTRKFLNNIFITASLLFLTTILTFILFFFISQNLANIALFYFIGILSVARYTNGYFYGMLASACSIILINCFYTYPYFDFNFSLPDYPFTFICMLTLSLVTSTSTSHIKRQAQVLALREEQLAEAGKESMRANLLRAVSHDLRTPLTSILGAVSSIENDARFTPREQWELIHNIHDDANWLLQMVENLLSVTKIHSTASELETSPELVEEVVAESVTRLKKRMPNAKINVSIPPEILIVPMDAMLIEQVLINLLENAILHSGSEKPVQLTVLNYADDVTFQVTDYGTGLKETQLEHIFDGTYSTGSSIDTQKGMGIGLSICHTIITAHRGTITAQNHADGSEFLFSLPKEKEAYE